jgi:peptide/nickel transport system substrate-binding protein
MPEIMRRFFRATFFLTFLFASCAPQPDVVAEPTKIPTPTESLSPAHVPEIRFALIGKLPASDVNVWKLFDESGATYINYALRAEYWPRLYHFAPQDSSFQPYAAEGLPSEVTQEGGGYSSVVKLRTNLKWTDGSPLTAEDIAFTVDTALIFELGYDWGSYYPRGYLDHAEVVDPSTVKFVFKQKPNVGIWQYGILQAPIVQKAFWESSVKDAAKLLPSEPFRKDVNEKRANLQVAQSDLADLTAQVVELKVSGKQSRKLEGDYTRMQGEVVYIQSALNKLLEEYTGKVKSAQEALYVVNDKEEPTLGTWMPDTAKDDIWVNKANPDFPFGAPNFDRSVYHFYEDENAALATFQNGEVDFVLTPDGVVGDVPDELSLKYSPSYSTRLLVFNPLNGYLADPAFRSALSCIIDRNALAVDVLQNKAAPLDSFVFSSQWHDSNLKDACSGMDKPARVAYAVKLLKDAGYSWLQEPTSESAGQNLAMSNGEAFPKITLLAPSKGEDALRYAAAKYIAEQAQYLGIPFAVKEVSLNDVVYAVYSSQKYDLALMGWQLSEYPAYLCEWFGGENLLLYNSTRFKPTCDALGGETNLNVARPAVIQIEGALMSELPFIPLFTLIKADVYHNISYPQQNILNGWSGLYGAPSYAIPAP